jgi:hypothetical protein
MQSAQTIIRVQRQLPTDRWMTLWRDGQAMSRDQAFHYALQVDSTPAIPTPPPQDGGRRSADTGEAAGATA